MKAADLGVTIVRTIDASPAAVFSAWIEPRLISRWLAPAPYRVVEVDVDARVGGRYRIAVAGPDGDVHVTTGEYVEIVPGKRLVKTWIYEGPHPAADRSETIVTVNFRELEDGRTRLTLRHDRLATEEGRELTRAGWSGCLDALETLHHSATPKIPRG